MEIRLEQVGKKFISDWIFKNLTFTFQSNTNYAILGRNGSGKSTLLQVIAGNLLPSAGTLTWSLGTQKIDEQKVFRHLALVAPYQELIEEFTLREMLGFHFSFKPIKEGYTIADLVEILAFGNIRSKPIRQFSSGMKQRVKLTCALFSDTPLLLLDEPTMNLDKAGIEWYHKLVTEQSQGRTVIICSNQYEVESGFCKEVLHIEDYK